MQKTNVGHALDEDGVGEPYTIFVPSNEALSNMKDGVLDYLLSPEVRCPPYSEDTMSASLLQSVSVQPFCKPGVASK